MVGLITSNNMTTIKEYLDAHTLDSKQAKEIYGLMLCSFVAGMANYSAARNMGVSHLIAINTSKHMFDMWLDTSDKDIVNFQSII